MRRSRAATWSVVACAAFIAAGCTGGQGQSGEAERNPQGAGASTPGAPTVGEVAAPLAGAQKINESAFVQREDDGVVTYNLARPDLEPQIVPGELLVKFRSTATRASVTSALASAATSEAHAFRSVPNLYHVKLAPGVQVADVVAEYAARPDVEYAEPNYVLSIHRTPNDPRFAELWGLHNTGQNGGLADVDIDAPESWDLTQGDDDLVVAVIDTGVDYNHPDLAANMYRNTADCNTNNVDDDANGYIDDCYGIDTFNGDSNPFDDHQHGTHVAGTIGAVGDNGVGVVGVAWNVKLLACKFLGAGGLGSTEGAIECLDYIATLKSRGVNIVASNNSWGGGAYSLALSEAIERNRQRDILFVAAAGNYSSDLDLYPSYPCSYDVANIVCVAAINRLGELAGFSNYGRTHVHLGAPGEDILSTTPNNGYGLLSGTSMAAPHVAGAAALLKTQDATRDWRALKNLLLTGSESPMPSSMVAGSRLNSNNALTCTDRQLVRKLRPNTDLEQQRIFRGVGAQIELEAFSIRCAGGNGPVSVSVSPGAQSVTLVDDGSEPDGVAGDGIAGGVWTASEAGQFTLTFPGSDTAAATIDAHLRAGFPVQTPNTSGSVLTGNNVHAVVGDIDADADLEIVLSALGQGPVYAWNPDGSVVSGWPTSAARGFGNAVIGNFENTLTGAKVGVVYNNGDIALHSQSGALRAGWPQPSGAYYWSRTPLAADLDNDGADELLDLRIFRADGTRFNQAMELRSEAAGDLDGDGDVELVSFEGYMLRVHHHDGEEAVEYRRSFPNHDSYGAVVLVGDVDGDGAAEPIVINRRYFPSSGVQAHLIGPWSIKRTIDVTSVNHYEPVSGAALGDLTGDGVPEIVVQTFDAVYAVRGAGGAVSGWPASIAGSQTGNAAPVIGDLTGDGSPEVATITPSYDPATSSSLVRVWSAGGAVLAGFPKAVPMLGQGGVPAIADLEGDGLNELIVVGDYWAGSAAPTDRLWVFDVQQSGAPGPVEWGQHKEGAHHRNFYALGKNLTNDAYLTVHLRGDGEVASSNAGINCGADCIERYARNTSVTLTATPNGGAFLGWLGACSGQGNPCTVSVQQRTSVVARFSRQPLTVTLEGSALGTVSSTPAGISCPTDCEASFDTDATVTLTATPAADGAFTGWSGACTGLSLTCTVEMSSAKSVIANFIAKPRLTVNVSGVAGGRVTSSPAGIDCSTGACDALFNPNTVVTLTATETEDYIVNWSGACYGSWSTCTVHVGTADLTASAHFVPKHALTVTKTGDVAGRIYSYPLGLDCGATCTYRFGENTSVQLWIDSFEYDVVWSGACSGAQSYCNVTMSAAQTVTVQLTRRQTLTLTKTGAADGAVESTPWGINCSGSWCTVVSAQFSRNAVVTLRASPTTYAIQWSGACTGSGPTCIVTMDQAKSVAVHFATRVELRVQTTGDGVVNSDPGGLNCGLNCIASFNPNTVVTLVATPNAGSVFDGWSGGCSGSSPSCTVTMDQSRFVAASFTARPRLTVAVADAAGEITSDPAGIQCGAQCSASFALNEVVTLTAAGTATTSFSHWSGACSGSSRTCSLTMGAPRAATAHFIAKPTLTVTMSGAGAITSTPAGLQCSSSCTAAFDVNTLVTLSAQPQAGNEFVGWSGACSGSSSTCEVRMDQARSVAVVFRAVAPPANGGGGGGGGGSFGVALICGVLLVLIGRRRRHAKSGAWT